MMLVLLVFQAEAFWTMPLVQPSAVVSNVSVSSSAGPYLVVLSSNSTSQNLSLQLDTTSSWLILKSSSLLSYSDSNCSSSISSEWAGQEIEGKICQIVINTNEKTLKQVKFLLTESEIIEHDGVLGLGSSRLSDGFLPFVEQLEESVFSIYLSEELPSVLTVGGYSDDFAVGDSVEVKSYPHFGTWRVPVESIFFGNSSFPIFTYAILNSSSVFITFPSTIFNSLVEGFKEILSCDVQSQVFCNITGVNVSSLPNFTIEINGNRFFFNFFDFAECLDERCEILFAADHGNRTILGIPFFKKFYLAFDSENFLVSLFQSNQNPNSNVFNTIYIVGVVVLAVIVSIPICFMYMLSKVRGVTEQTTGYDKLN